jgi:hypothetical protein
MATQSRGAIHLLVRMLVAAALAFATLCASPETGHSGERISAQSSPVQDSLTFLPIIFGPVTPAGTYDCNEYEFGLIWTGEVITLNVDGSSVYAYYPPYSAVVTGTWVYTSAIQQVGFTNFRWITVTFQAPDRLWASQYLPRPGFDVAIDCSRHK